MLASLQRLCCTQQQLKGCDAATSLAPLIPTYLASLVLAPDVIISAVRSQTYVGTAKDYTVTHSLKP